MHCTFWVWAHVCGPQPGGLDRDSRRRPMPLIILGRRRLRLDMTTQGRGYDHDTSGRRHAAAMSGGLAGCFDGFLRITFGCDDYRGGGGRLSCSKEAESRSSTKKQGASISGVAEAGWLRRCHCRLRRVPMRQLPKPLVLLECKQSRLSTRRSKEWWVQLWPRRCVRLLRLTKIAPPLVPNARRPTSPASTLLRPFRG